jgi:hypothetical protein
MTGPDCRDVGQRKSKFERCLGDWARMAPMARLSGALCTWRSRLPAKWPRACGHWHGRNGTGDRPRSTVHWHGPQGPLARSLVT